VQQFSSQQSTDLNPASSFNSQPRENSDYALTPPPRIPPPADVDLEAPSWRAPAKQGGHAKHGGHYVGRAKIFVENGPTLIERSIEIRVYPSMMNRNTNVPGTSSEFKWHAAPDTDLAPKAGRGQNESASLLVKYLMAKYHNTVGKWEDLERAIFKDRQPYLRTSPGSHGGLYWGHSLWSIYKRNNFTIVRPGV
jgi:hypothetical protein